MKKDIKANRQTTMVEVAKQSGVSLATASCVLNGTSSNMRVGEATRQRVMTAAKELGYTPNALARAFRRQQTNIIGLYLGDWLINTHQVFLAEIVSGLQIGCNEHRKDLLIHGTFRGSSVDDVYAELANGKVDGLIMFARAEDPLVKRLSESPLAAVAVADIAPGLPSVVVDDAGGSIMLAQYLAKEGHKCVLYKRVAIPQSSALRRKAAFLEEAAVCGMSVVESDSDDPVSGKGLSPIDVAYLTGNVKSVDRPTAIVCSTDDFAYEVVFDCFLNGLKVPGDVAVAGFNGIDTPGKLGISLTTIYAPWSRVARTAVDLLIKRISGEEVSSETVLPVEFTKGLTA